MGDVMMVIVSAFGFGLAAHYLWVDLNGDR